MSQIRKAHSVEIIDRRLRDCETTGACDLLEVVGIYDELARVERKWIGKASELKTGTRAVGRPLSDAAQLNARFERLSRLVEAALRQPATNSPERVLLEQAAMTLRDRKPLPT